MFSYIKVKQFVANTHILLIDRCINFICYIRELLEFVIVQRAQVTDALLCRIQNLDRQKNNIHHNMRFILCDMQLLRL